MLEVAQALPLVLQHTSRKPPARVPLSESLGLALAEEVTSDVDSPPHDKAMVDGYALIAADLHAGAAELGVLEEVTAGAVPTRNVSPGHCTRIMTGAPLPAGADAVSMIEDSTLLPDANRVRIRATARPGQNIMTRGASLRIGQVVLAPGHEIRPAEIGLLAEVGRAEVAVFPRPRVAVLSTGNELVDAAARPGPGQIRNSNGPLLVAAAWRAGAVPHDLGIARDDRAELRAKIEQGLAADVLVLSGGVSAGVLDLVPSVLKDLGVEQVFHKVNLKPGKPLWFGAWKLSGSETTQSLVFGVPGNPVSSLVCFELFTRPAIAKLAGRDEQPALRSVPIQLAAEFVHRGDRPTYHPGVMRRERNAFVAEPVQWRGSADLQGLNRANVLLCFPGGDRTWQAGEAIDALLF